LEEARAIAATAGDPFILGITLNNLGVVRSVIRGEAESAYALFEESYRVRAGMGDLARMALSLATLSETAMELEDRARAREFATEALELAREVGDRREAGAALLMLAWVALYEGQVDAARELFTDALALAREISNPASARIALRGLAAVAAATRAGPLTARLAAATEHDLRESFLAPSLRALVERHLAEAQAETDPVEWEEAWQQGAALSIDQATAEILQATAAN
jgi:tetratricopeptide (TPR) repeat protein